ncbi:M20 family metallopeptidase [Candidatus Saccharibacteria bacterium]|nr:M20 family metallopeptidase [Candidatus Saccharibacteria bacterium]
MLEKTLKELVEFYPQSEKQENVKQLCKYVEKSLKNAGLFTSIFKNDGVYSLYAGTKGTKKTKLLLQAHIDVVPGEGQGFRQTDNKYFGRGVYDMLFATACFIKLINELKPNLKNYNLGIMLTGDEELGGFNGVKSLLDKGYSADLCILPDAGEGFGSLNIGAKGILILELTVQGKAHHGSRPWEGDGAASKMVKFLSEVEELFDMSNTVNSTVTIAKINSGDSENKGPATADCTLDIRYKSQDDLTRIYKHLNSLFLKYDVSIKNEKNGQDYVLDKLNPYVQQFIKIYKKENNGIINFTRAHGSSDARFFAEKNIPVIMLRPDGGGAHGDEEWISKESIEKFYKLLKKFVTKFSRVNS